MNSNRLERVNVDRSPHPGALLLEYLDWAGWSQQELAQRTGLTAKTISEICNGKAPITARSALALEPVLGRPANLWLGMQRRYEEMEARKGLQSKHSDWSDWIRKFPLKEMEQHDWIPSDKTSKDSIPTKLLHFFGVASPESWSKTWESQRIAYRRSDLVHANKFAIAAWIRATEIEAASISTYGFDDEKARMLIQDLRGMTNKSPESYFDRWREACANAGIALVVLPQLKGTAISGCARWLSDSKAVIALTSRYKTDDQIWLTFFHELAHLILHRKIFRFVLDLAEDSIYESEVDPKMVDVEREANAFAEEALIPSKHLTQFLSQRSFSCASIEKFASDVNVGAGIVVGRLQRAGVIDYHACNHLKRRISLASTP